MQFDEVYKQELEEIARRRARRSGKNETSVARVEAPDTVLAAIRERVARDTPGEPSPDAPPEGLSGIAISGGGIRSATFALGVLQGLTKHRLFERADYLSTVSGGGYIGSCLSSMFASGVKRFPFRRRRGQPERPLIRHLRRYSNYLLPSGPLDALSMPGVLLRGIIATFVTILPWLMLGIIVLVLGYGERVSKALVNGTAAVVDVSRTDGALGESPYAFTIRRGMERHAGDDGVEGRDLLRSCNRDPTNHYWTPTTDRVVDSFAAVVAQVPCTHGDFLVYGLPTGTMLQTACSAETPDFPECVECRDGIVSLSDTAESCRVPEEYVARQLDDGGWYVASEARNRLRAVFPASAGDAFTVRIKQRSKTPGSEEDYRTWQPPSIWDDAFVVTGSLLAITALALLAYPLVSSLGRRNPAARDGRAGGWLSKIYPTLLVLLVLSFAVEVQPIAAYAFTAAWSWLSASAAIANIDYIVYALIGFGVVVASWVLRPTQAPEESSSGRGKLFLIGLIGPLGLWLLALLIAHWTLCRPPDLLLRWVLQPMGAYNLPGALYSALNDWVPFGKTVIAALGLRDVPWQQIIEFRVSPSMCFGEPELPGVQDHLNIEQWRVARDLATTYEDLALPPGAYAALCTYAIIGITAFVYSSLFLNVNRISLHRYYRDRLSAAYILRPVSTPEGRVVENDEQRLDALGDNGCVGPYHLLNGALNMSEDERSGRAPHLDSQDKRNRSVDHFLFSMLHVGSDATGYCDSRQMHEADPHVDLGTAMAISGAAASPRMGEFTVSTLAVLMVLLNARLGYWLPNPGKVAAGEKPWGRRLLPRPRPRPGPRYIGAEISGKMSPRRAFVNVSDGGHIENLGVYSLVKRRCRMIVAIDGERDSPTGEHGFAGLATVIRMARIELGVEIEIDVDGVGALGGPHFAIGRIVYGEDDHGWLVYLKLSYSGDENAYVREYRMREHPPQFPHQSTGDQFFDEAQFEAYRALGQHVAEEFIDARVADLGDAPHLAPLRGLDGDRAEPARHEGTI